MDHAKSFTPDTVLDDLGNGEMEEVLDELMRGLVEAHGIGPKQAKEIREALDRKLTQGATGAIGHGVAIPHVKIASAKETRAVFGRTPKGVDFRAPDGVPVNLFFFVVGPEDAHEEHLGFMRWIAGIARNDDFRRFATGCQGRKELHELLQEMSQAC